MLDIEDRPVTQPRRRMKAGHGSGRGDRPMAVMVKKVKWAIRHISMQHRFGIALVVSCAVIVCLLTWLMPSFRKSTYLTVPRTLAATGQTTHGKYLTVGRERIQRTQFVSKEF